MAYLVITPNSDRGEGRVRIDPEHGEVFGENPCHRFYLGQGQPTGFSGWFIIQVRRQPSSYGVYSGSEIREHVTFIQNEKKSGAYLSFPVKAGEQIIVKVASSFVSVDGARHNMETECPGWNFDRVRSQLAKQWERHLSVVEVTGGNKDALTKFYTSLYRTAFCPHAFSDADGRYPSFAGGKTIEKTYGTYFTDYSLWETFR